MPYDPMHRACAARPTQETTQAMASHSLTAAHALPQDAARAHLIGRLWLPDVGPVLVACHRGQLHDLSRLALTLNNDRPLLFAFFVCE